ncbi:MAG: hypothetical protein RIF32_11265 [Leptospirales bacterium]
MLEIHKLLIVFLPQFGVGRGILLAVAELLDRKSDPRVFLNSTGMSPSEYRRSGA